ncbi:DUF6483 family protein [Secundilactobacillus muriivasis]
MQRGEDDDWILKQIKQIAYGIGYVLSGGKGNDPQFEVVFPQPDTKALPYQKEIQLLIDQHQYAKAADRLLSVQYAMADADFMKLGVWFYDTVNGIPEAQLEAGGYSKAAIVAGLKQLAKLRES